MQQKPVQINLIGDSLAQFSNGFNLQVKMGSNFILTNPSVYGRTVNDWIEDVSNIVSPNPDTIIIELGTNDAMQFQSPEYFIENLKTLISEIQKRTNAKIILTAIPLTNAKGLHSIIQSQNQLIRNLGYAYVDLENEFSKVDSNISLYPINDPIHPEPVGYEIIGEVYRKTILMQIAK